MVDLKKGTQIKIPQTPLEKIPWYDRIDLVIYLPIAPFKKGGRQW